MLTINVYSAALPTQLLAHQGKCYMTTKLSTLHFAMVDLDNRELWVVGKPLSLTY